MKIITNGYYLSHRSLFTHWLWKKRVLSDWEAWQCFLAATNFEDKNCEINNKIVPVKRGQFITSVKHLMDFFMWTNHRTRFYLKTLADDGMIHLQTDTHYTRITICNYDKYQNTPLAKHSKNFKNPLDLFVNPAHASTTTKEVIKEEVKQITLPLTPLQGAINIFETFRVSYPGTKRGLETEFDYFKKKNKDWTQILPNLSGAVERQKQQREILRQNNEKFIPAWKNLKTWICNRGWEEQIGIPSKVAQKKIHAEIKLPMTLEDARKEYKKTGLIPTVLFLQPFAKHYLALIPKEFQHPMESTTFKNYFNRNEH